MADEQPKAPATKTSRVRQSLGPGEKSDTGGDWYNRMRGNYAKNPPQSEESPFFPMGYGSKK